MTKYRVSIKTIDEYSIDVEADSEDYAIAEAFDNRYLWKCSYAEDTFEINVKKVSDD